MGLIKQKTNFISAKCPECGGALNLHTNLETAVCQKCGMQCIIENTPKRSNSKNNLETILNFVEHQQNIRKQEKQENATKANEQEIKREQFIKKYGLAYALFMFVLFALVIVMTILENIGLI